MSATSSTSWAREAWKRAGAAQKAQLALVRISHERTTESALRLDRSHDQLNGCEPRVTRGKQRRV